MPSLQWDRLLETCYRRHASDLLLTAGSPPLIRLPDRWHTLQVPPLTAADLETLTREQFSTTPGEESDGHIYWDFTYHEALRFRALAFGYPSTRLLLISHHPGDNPQPQGAGT